MNPPEHIGLNPIIKFRNLNQRKSKETEFNIAPPFKNLTFFLEMNYADNRHKQWLKDFAGEIEDMKSLAYYQQEQEVDKFYRIREREAMRRRKIMKHKKRDYDNQKVFDQS